MNVVEYLKEQLRNHILVADAGCQTDPIEPVVVPVLDIDQHKDAVIDHITNSPTGKCANYVLNAMRDRITFMPKAVQPLLSEQKVRKRSKKASPSKPMRIPNELLDDVQSLLKKRKYRSDASDRSEAFISMYDNTAVDDDIISVDDLDTPVPRSEPKTDSSMKFLEEIQEEHDQRVRDDEEIDILNKFTQSIRTENITKAVAYCLESDEKGVPFALAQVAKSFRIPRSTLKREYQKAVNGLDVDGDVALRTNGKPDMRCLRQILLRRYVQQHGGDVITASSKFKGVSTSDMLNQLSPEEKAQLKPLLPDEQLD